MSTMWQHFQLSAFSCTAHEAAWHQVCMMTCLQKKKGEKKGVNDAVLEQERDQLANALERLADVQRELAEGQRSLMTGHHPYPTSALAQHQVFPHKVTALYVVHAVPALVKLVNCTPPATNGLLMWRGVTGFRAYNIAYATLAASPQELEMPASHSSLVMTRR